jgi:cytochrome c556
MRRLITAACCSLVVAAAAITSANADTTPANAIKYRKAVMNAMAAHFGAFFMINMGSVDKPQYLASHVDALAAMGDQLDALFPAGSGTGKTDALPAIWENPEKFQKAVATAKGATAKLRDAVKGGDKAAIGQAAKAAGDSCKGCHDSFRKEEKGEKAG